MAAPPLEFFDFNHKLLRSVARNWKNRAQHRESNKVKLATGGLRQVESAERIAANESFRQEAQAETRRMTAAMQRPVSVDLFQERVIGGRDFLGVEFLEMAAAVSRFVGRIQIRFQPNKIRGYGTGFVVSPRLLLTNNHVLPTADSARHSLVEFDYQKDRFGQPLTVVVCALDPDSFFITNPALDFSLVAVSETTVRGKLLRDYAWVRLHAETGKALIGDALNIVQHPRGEMKQLVLRSNKLVDLFDDLVHYETDTDPGSSGSPVFNDYWQVVALHHSGVPATNDAGDLVDINGQVWRDGDDPDRLAWVGNEGIRVSSLVRAIEKAKLDTSEKKELRRQMLELEPPHPLEFMKQVPEPNIPNPGTPANSNGAVTVTIPLHVTVSLGLPVAGTPTAPQTPATERSMSTAVVNDSPPVDRKPRHDRDDDTTEQRVLEAARKKFGDLPGVLRIELGHEFVDGWITERRALVVTIHPKRKGKEKMVKPTLPDEFMGMPVQTTGPSIEDLVSLRSGRAVAEAVFAGSDLSQEITYTELPGNLLKSVTDTMRVIAHLSPDAGWPQLEKFIGGTKSSLTIGIYDFGAEHALKAIKALKSKSTFNSLTLAIQKGESVGEGTKADDLHDDEIVDALHDTFGNKFKQAWVKIGRVNGWVASSYHIKVIVRDGKAFWLSSGNIQSSNQPDADPLGESPRTKDWLKRYNREWHAIVEHGDLAKTFEKYLLHDYDNNRGTDGREDFVLPDILLPAEFFAREAAEDPSAWEYFEPFDQKRTFTVTPILTPDNYHKQVLKLIRSAESELLIQNQTFNAPKDDHDKLRELVEAVLEKQRDGVSVRVIFRLMDRPKARQNLSALMDLGFDMDAFRVQKNCHTKGIIVDGQRVLLGSQNWSNDGVSQNRDASLLFDDEELAAYFKKVFEHDWLALADKDIGPEDGGLELATSLEDTPPGMVRLTWKDYMETW